jgi:hypothetical protein
MPHDEREWAEFGRAVFAQQISRIEVAVESLPRLAEQAAVFFAEQDQRLKRVEKLLLVLAEKGGATAEELAPLAEATQELGASREELQRAVNTHQPTKE